MQTPSKTGEADYAAHSEPHHDELNAPILGMGSLSFTGSSEKHDYHGTSHQRAGNESYETPVRPSTSRFIEHAPRPAATPTHQRQEGDTPSRQHDAMVKYLDETTRDVGSSSAENVERDPNNSVHSTAPVAAPVAQVPRVSPYAFGAMNPYMVYPHTPFSPYPSHGMMVPQYSPFYGPAPAPFPEMYGPVMYPPPVPMVAPPAHEANQETPTRVHQTRRRRENDDHGSQSDPEHQRG